ncbi:hypothetical protein ACFV6F_14955 [Kitasatospora phosalacinea]|uniref:hypothetical protein n=1 Tax=Kitasatospora phosalacinea TaxID=2065 RepID=UPI0036654163
MTATLAVALLSGAADAPHTGRGARVDLYFADLSAPTAPPGEGATQTVVVGNRGEDATGPVSIKFTTPVLVNVDRARPLPEDCRFRYTDRDPAVPETLECVRPPLPHGGLITLALPVVAVDPAAPAVATYGMLSVLPAAGSADTDTNSTNSVFSAVFTVQRGPASELPPGANPVDLHLVGDTPAIRPDGTGLTVLTVGNGGQRPTTGPVRVVYVTPLFTNVDHRLPLPPECTMLLVDPDPSVPEVVQCVRDTPLGPGGSWSLRLPLTVVPGGPSGQNFGASIVTPGTRAHPGPDAETHPTDNLFEPSVTTLA